VIYSPQEAQEVAFAIGRILRDTQKVMRGLGTIRQDLNVSLPNGALIEIKGVQELELISIVVDYEVQRQLNLLAIKDELAKGGHNTRPAKTTVRRCHRVIQGTKSKVIRKAVDKTKKSSPVKLPASTLNWRELMPNFR
jgi:glutamyl-tRNA(Gln) amidotransferase subunit E